MSLSLGFTFPSEGIATDPLKKEALQILQTQCNACHRTENPMRVFTEANMNAYAKKINRQVFVWKRMPKGNKNELSSSEKETLKNWINNLNL